MTNLLIICSFWCACKICTGTVAQPTASGIMPRVGITISAPRSVPFGTIVDLPGIGRRIVQDRASRKYDHRWDVFVASHAEAKRLGIKKVMATIYGPPLGI